MGPIKSILKSVRLRRLQKRLHPRNLSASGRVRRDLFSDDYDRAHSTYLDFCVADPNVRTVMQKYGIGREKLEDIYHNLCRNGAGQWTGGHFAAASSIAYAEPLQFVLEAERIGIGSMDISWTLLQYFSNEIPVGELHLSLGKP